MRFFFFVFGVLFEFPLTPAFFVVQGPFVVWFALVAPVNVSTPAPPPARWRASTRADAAGRGGQGHPGKAGAFFHRFLLPAPFFYPVLFFFCTHTSFFLWRCLCKFWSFFFLFEKYKTRAGRSISFDRKTGHRSLPRAARLDARHPPPRPHDTRARHAFPAPVGVVGAHSPRHAVQHAHARHGGAGVAGGGDGKDGRTGEDRKRERGRRDPARQCADPPRSGSIDHQPPSFLSLP